MRTPRIAILALFFSASLFLVLRFVSSGREKGPTIAPLSSQKSSFRTFFSFAPFSLFPPSAAISLTDDNSTFFPARPAAFGPDLPSDGLSGRLWIGSGFAEDTLQEGEGEGELGCSDVAGFEDGRLGLPIKSADQGLVGDKSGASSAKSKNPKRGGKDNGPLVDRTAAPRRPPTGTTPPVDDGTDDYLHKGLQQSKGTSGEPSSNLGSSHADIQSIQETAEITGKIVLLSRGGCGFLEKVKWAQRRGAIALIVGDNQKGGPLIQMFARGNVDNVTIPSVFTSWTTAHLLSSLVQPGSFIEDILDEYGNPVLKVQQSGKGKKGKKSRDGAQPTTPAPKTTPKPKSAKTGGGSHDDAAPAADKSAPARRSWISRLFHWGSDDSAASDRRRPPSSGQLDWVVVDEWSDEKDKLIKSSLDKASKNGADDSSAAKSGAAQGDSFQIGVHDWRDPDLVGSSPDSSTSVPAKGAGKSTGDNPANSRGASSKQTGKGSAGLTSGSKGPKGGSITPGSGEYVPEAVTNAKSSGPGKSDEDGADASTQESPASTNAPSTSHSLGDNDGPAGREGLWITITPTSSASSFFDTLLVLVVSPLITLTVVYALLMLRAKIRRRRWRAPKSVVERLPVRTYQTVAPSPTLSPRLPSPTSSSPTTPLLQGSSRSRPRSRTTTGVPEPGDALRVDTDLQASTPQSQEHRKAHGSSEWKKYMGKQVECVVCLEEYVDGVSRVMSLPCGHEFHVECITPWLTTRRRTCPICKGDVVRSLARGSPSSPRYEPYRDDSDEDAPVPGPDPGPRLGLSGIPGMPGWAMERDDQPPPEDPESDIERGAPTFMSQPRRQHRGSRREWYDVVTRSFLHGAGFSNPAIREVTRFPTQFSGTPRLEEDGRPLFDENRRNQ